MQRIYHTWDEWECYPAGFYEKKPRDKSLSDEDCRNAYAAFPTDLPRFKAAMDRVLAEWPNSCEHYLSNENMNRIAWLGQAAMCIATGIPSQFRGGFVRLNDTQQIAANYAALDYLNKWLVSRGEKVLSMQEAKSKTEASLY